MLSFPVILTAFPLEEAKVRGAPHERDFERCEGRRHHGRLGYHSHPRGDLAWRKGSDVVAAEDDSAFVRPEGTAHQLQQRRFAASVGPDDAHELSFADLQADAS